MKYLIVLVCAVLLSGCKSGSTDFEGMDNSERTISKRQGNEVVVYMSLETMFSDQQVRELAKAAGKGHLDKIESLVVQGVDVNSRGNKGATPLFWAMRNIDGFKKLLELGADPNIVFAGGSVMHWSAGHRDVSFLRLCLSHGGDPDLVAGQFNETPIFKTIGVGGDDHRAAMVMLLDAGANIDAVTGGDKVFGISMGGQTPIMAAGDLGRFDIVYELLERGANYDAKDDTGRDLMDRIASLNGRYVEGSAQEKSLEQVIEWLEIRGVSLPGD